MDESTIELDERTLKAAKKAICLKNDIFLSE